MKKWVREKMDDVKTMVLDRVLGQWRGCHTKKEGKGVVQGVTRDES